MQVQLETNQTQIFPMTSRNIFIMLSLITLYRVETKGNITPFNNTSFLCMDRRKKASRNIYSVAVIHVR